MSELKPCPFCGRNAERVTWDQTEIMPVIFHAIKCVCGAQTRWFRTAEEAATAWNQRAEPTAQPGLVERVREALSAKPWDECPRAAIEAVAKWLDKDGWDQPAYALRAELERER